MTRNNDSFTTAATVETEKWDVFKWLLCLSKSSNIHFTSTKEKEKKLILTFKVLETEWFEND